jgi:hypothetical protein
MADANDTVLYERREPGIALLTLNRPERLNAWNAELASRYFELLDQAAHDPEIRSSRRSTSSTAHSTMRPISRRTRRRRRSRS